MVILLIKVQKKNYTEPCSLKDKVQPLTGKKLQNRNQLVLYFKIFIYFI